MCFSCISCDGKCTPLGTNVIGVHIQEFKHNAGWRKASEPYKCYSMAKEAMNLIPNDGIERRVYSAFAEEDIIIGVYR